MSTWDNFDSNLEKYNPHKDYYKACEKLKIEIAIEFNLLTKAKKSQYDLLPEPFVFGKDYYRKYIKLLESADILKIERETSKRR